jgi:hypothetical protein
MTWLNPAGACIVGMRMLILQLYADVVCGVLLCMMMQRRAPRIFHALADKLCLLQACQGLMCMQVM